MHTRIAAVVVAVVVVAAVALASGAAAQDQKLLERIEVARLLAEEGITEADFRLAGVVAARLEAEGLSTDDLPPRRSVVELATARRNVWSFGLVLAGIVVAFAMMYLPMRK